MNRSVVDIYDDRTRRWSLVHGDALELLSKLPADSIDLTLSDPPYGLSFHGETWDGSAIQRAAAAGHARLGAAEAFERWSCLWAHMCRRAMKPGAHLVAFGAPRTFHRLVAGVEDAGLEIRDVVMWVHAQGLPKSRRLPDGAGTGLKPSFEPILIARRPLVGSAPVNRARYGTGTLNIDAARIGNSRGAGYWPANLALSHHPDCPVAHVDGGAAGPSRLFFCPKAGHGEREAGCEDLPVRASRIYTGRHRRARLVRNIHPTVKPLELMRWLVRLAAPKGGIVLDPFSGSATTGVAAMLEGRRFLGIEREADYVDIATARLTHWATKDQP